MKTDPLRQADSEKKPLSLSLSDFEAEAQKRIGEVLVEMGFLSPSQVETILKESQAAGERFGETALRLDMITERELAKALARKAGLEYVDLRDVDIDPETARIVDLETAERCRFLPLYRERDGHIVVAITDPFNSKTTNAASDIAALVKLVVVEPSLLLFLFEKVFEEASYEKKLDSLISEAIKTIEREGPNTPIPTIGQIVNLIVLKGLAQGATDIHLVADSKSFRIFYRIRGQIVHFKSYKSVIYSQIASVIKTQCGLSSGEILAIQDGSMTLSVEGRNIYLRVSRIPTVPQNESESLVLRILDKNRINLSLDSLGFYESDLERLRKAISAPYGMILVTGPTGSGKTTTLYSILAEKDPFQNTILTIEDPVEYQLPGLRQVQVNETAGITFASALKAFLRQDPDVILVGEIRDAETAETAVNAALTGHLVLSTLHTNTAVEALPRLEELEVVPSILSQALIAVISQRLVRVLCPRCRRERPISPSERETFESEGLRPPERLYDAVVGKRDCPLCNGSGYSSMTAVYEILFFDDDFRRLVEEKRPLSEFIQLMQKKKQYRLNQIALMKVRDGITTIEEVSRRVLKLSSI